MSTAGVPIESAAKPEEKRPKPAGRPYTGALVVVEGIDGSGKSTQLHLLKRWLEVGGYKTYFTEWNSSPLVKSATRRGKKRHLLTPVTFSLIHAADFADRYERQILPLLRSGYLVLADRYIYTAFARDGARGCPIDWLRNLYQYAVIPDVTFYFRAPLEVAIRRILSGRPRLKYYEAGMDLGLSLDPIVELHEISRDDAGSLRSNGPDRQFCFNGRHFAGPPTAAENARSGGRAYRTEAVQEWKLANERIG